jgi:hypothetical protein
MELCHSLQKKRLQGRFSFLAYLNYVYFSFVNINVSTVLFSDITEMLPSIWSYPPGPVQMRSAIPGTDRRSTMAIFRPSVFTSTLLKMLALFFWGVGENVNNIP